MLNFSLNRLLLKGFRIIILTVFDLGFRLDLRNNDIGLGGLMALSLAARENKSLTRLDLDKPPRDSTLPPELIVSSTY